MKTISTIAEHLTQCYLPSSVMPSRPEFAFEQGADVFAPNDLIKLARPGSGVVNDEGDLVIVPVSKYSFEDKR